MSSSALLSFAFLHLLWFWSLSNNAYSISLLLAFWRPGSRSRFTWTCLYTLKKPPDLASKPAEAAARLVLHQEVLFKVQSSAMDTFREQIEVLQPLALSLLKGLASRQREVLV